MPSVRADGGTVGGTDARRVATRSLQVGSGSRGGGRENCVVRDVRGGFGIHVQNHKEDASFGWRTLHVYLPPSTRAAALLEEFFEWAWTSLVANVDPAVHEWRLLLNDNGFPHQSHASMRNHIHSLFGVSTHMLRRIYSSSEAVAGLPLESRAGNARVMGHSLRTQESSYNLLKRPREEALGVRRWQSLTAPPC